MTKDIIVGIDEQLYEGARETLGAAELRKVVEEAIRKRMSQSQDQPSEQWKKAKGAWKHRTDIGDGVEYQRKLRAEWEHREGNV